ncbi:MAG: Nif3-like dinuclear metal center hexameric protein [Planctomycetota bacterium]
MPTIGDVANVLEQFAPTALAEDWDNVGLLVGDPTWPVRRVTTCLTVTPQSVAEAVREKADLVVAHHPLPFQPLKSITTATTPGRLLLDLISAKIGVYSPHTAFDSAPTGINQHLAIGLGLQQIEPLVPTTGTVEADIGAGRTGTVGGESTLLELVGRVKNFLGIDAVRVVGANDQPIGRVAIACGSGGSFLPHAVDRGCDCLVTGETSFHTCLEAEALGVGLILPGHFASERFALLSLAEYLQEQIPGIDVWASRDEQDPLRTV